MITCAHAPKPNDKKHVGTSVRKLAYGAGREWQLNCARKLRVSAFVVSIQRKLIWLQRVIDTNPLLALAIKPLLLVITCTCGLVWWMDYH